MLLRSLPPDSATARETHGERAEWGVAEHLLAAAIDALNAANWQRSADKKIPRPKPIPRPTDRPTRLTLDEVRARLLEQRQRRNKRKG